MRLRWAFPLANGNVGPKDSGRAGGARCTGALFAKTVRTELYMLTDRGPQARRDLASCRVLKVPEAVLLQGRVYTKLREPNAAGKQITDKIKLDQDVVWQY